MSAIGYRFALAVTFSVCGHAVAMEPNLIPPSEKQSPRGVAEYADEFAEAKQAEKPLIAWLHPFTERIAYGSYGPIGQADSPYGGIGPRKPDVYLEDDVDLTAVQPTAIERLIAQGYGTGDGRGAGKPASDEQRPDISRHIVPADASFPVRLELPCVGLEFTERPDITNHLAN